MKESIGFGGTPPPFLRATCDFKVEKIFPTGLSQPLRSCQLPTSHLVHPQKKFVRVKIVKIEIQVHALKAINHGSHTGTTWSHGRSPPDEVRCADWKRTPTKWWTNYMHIICMYIDIYIYRERYIYKDIYIYTERERVYIIWVVPPPAQDASHHCTLRGSQP